MSTAMATANVEECVSSLLGRPRLSRVVVVDARPTKNADEVHDAKKVHTKTTKKINGLLNILLLVANSIVLYSIC